MKIGKSGVGLAIRIPAAIVKEMNLKPGDEMQIVATGGQRFEVCKMEEPVSEAEQAKKRLEALEYMRKLRFELPENYVFHRDQIYNL